jgi:hypothetical protein
METALLARAQSAAARFVRAENREEALALMPMLPPEVRRTLVEVVARTWDREDLGAAEEWMASLEDEKLREEARGHLVRPTSEQTTQWRAEPSLADIVRDLGSEDSATRLRLRRWNAEEIAEAVQALRSEAPDARMRGTEALISRDGEDAPPALRGEAFRYSLDRSMAESAGDEVSGRRLRQLTGEISDNVVYWARMDPGAAADWVTSLPESEAREWAVRNLVHTWVEQAPGEARAWVEGLQEGEEREAARLILGE